jgi:hypothetical protein
MHMPRLLIVLGCLAFVGCKDRTRPAAPIMDVRPEPVAVTGTERIGWDQPAATSAELAKLRFVVYVDGDRTELPDASCAPAQAPASTFRCTARLPTLSRGTHNLQLASALEGRADHESARAGPLTINVIGTATP